MTDARLLSWLALLGVGLPFVGALFAALVPSNDRTSRRYVVMSSSIFGSLLLCLPALISAKRLIVVEGLSLWPGIAPLSLLIDPSNYPFMLTAAVAFPLAIRGGATSEFGTSQQYGALALVSQGAASFSLLCDDMTLALCGLWIASLPVGLLLVLGGGGHKGSIALDLLVTWTIGDVLLIGMPAFDEQPVVALSCWVVFVVVRLGIFPASSLWRRMLSESPTGGGAIVVGGLCTAAARIALASIPVDSLVDVRVHSGLAWSGAVCVLAAASRAHHERDCVRFAASAFSMMMALWISAVIVDVDLRPLAALGTATCCVSAAALRSSIDELERRYLSREALGFANAPNDVPLLWRTFAICMSAASAVPLLGPGAVAPVMLWHLTDIAESALPSTQSAAIALAFLVGLIILWSALAAHLRRTLIPTSRRHGALQPVSRSTAAQLALLAFVVVGSGLWSGWQSTTLAVAQERQQ